jgi:hypothetical protein
VRSISDNLESMALLDIAIPCRFLTIRFGLMCHHALSDRAGDMIALSTVMVSLIDLRIESMYECRCETANCTKL